MNVCEMKSGATLIESPQHADDRGAVVEHELAVPVVRELRVDSVKRVLRGVHYQDPRRAPLTKILTVEVGSIFEVLVNLKTGAVDWLWLGETDRKLLVIPPWTAHGYVVTDCSVARVRYRFDVARDELAERQIFWESVGAPWPVTEPLLSKKDSVAQFLSDALVELQSEYIAPLTESRA